jgi:hypothetical protein
LNPRPLGYGQCDARLRCLGASHVARLTWPDGQSDVAPDRWRLHRPTLSRCVSFTNPFTSRALVGPSRDRWTAHFGGGPTVLQIMTAVPGALPITCVNAMTQTRGYALVPRISHARLFAPAPPQSSSWLRQIIAVPAAQSRGRPRRLRPDRLRPACALPPSGCRGQTRRRRRCCAGPRRPGPDRLRPVSALSQSGRRGRSRTWRCRLSLQDLFRYPRRTAWLVHGQAQRASGMSTRALAGCFIVLSRLHESSLAARAGLRPSGKPPI